MKPLEILPQFFDVLVKQSARFKVFYGGRSGAKSHNFARAILHLMSLGRLRVNVGRQFYSTIGDSNKTLFDDIIIEHELPFKSNQFIIANNLGSIISFSGLDRNIESTFKGKEKVDIFWIEEAQVLTQETIDTVIPTIIRNPGAEIWISMNVGAVTDPAYREFIASQRPNSIGGWRTIESK